MSKEFRNVIISMQEELKGVKLENQSLKEYMRGQTAAAEHNSDDLVTQQDLKNQVRICNHSLVTVELSCSINYVVTFHSQASINVYYDCIIESSSISKQVRNETCSYMYTTHCIPTVQ